jgi:hypothetical protein
MVRLFMAPEVQRLAFFSMDVLGMLLFFVVVARVWWWVMRHTFWRPRTGAHA